ILVRPSCALRALAKQRMRAVACRILRRVLKYMQTSTAENRQRRAKTAVQIIRRRQKRKSPDSFVPGPSKFEEFGFSVRDAVSVQEEVARQELRQGGRRALARSFAPKQVRRDAPA